MRSLNNHGFSRISFAHARFIERAVRPYPPKSEALRAERSEGIAKGRESAPYLLCESGGQGTAHPAEIGRALAKAIRVIRGLIFAFAGVGMISSAFAATGSSPEFKVDLRGLGPWQRRTAAATEALTYSSAWATNAASGAKAVVKVMPVLKSKPKYLVIDLSGGTNATSYVISYLDEVPGGTWSDEYKTNKLVLRHIPAGSFIMGGRNTDYPGAVNTNLHMVTITRDFYMGVFEVTQRQWELVMGTRPSDFTNEMYYATRPVERVSRDAIRGTGAYWPQTIKVEDCSFVGVLGTKSGMCGFDLPTESQWEYACRAGVGSALNRGKDLSSSNMSAAVSEVARYGWNSGWSDDPVFSVKFSNGTADVGTAKVGSYLPNKYGMYDMHGNVWEWCLDWWEDIAEGCVDPVGPKKRINIVLTRGGGFNNSAKFQCSGFRGNGIPENTGRNVGFRLCLQGGDIPDLASATTLVNESGAGSQSWTPMRSGAYYLTHSTMNGATNAQLLSAWFEVPGCTLTLEPQGELTNGVNVAIGGAGDGWTVYYTTDGSVPTTNSTVYAGTFSLPASATVRAVAYNEQGVASEETSATFTLHDALGVASAVARQRYPWNGMVDVDVVLKGNPEAKYEVEVEAKYLEGGTNLAVKTVYVDESGGHGVTALPSLSPGTYRLVWDAAADIAVEGEFPRVAVTVKATRQSAIANYPQSLAITVADYAGNETLTNVPVLVRLSTNITGFAYSDFARPTNGADLAFFDADENALPYEIDEWHTNGESLVWVKLPEMTKGTTITCAYGNASAAREGTSSTEMKHAVWSEYAGVWHMNEDSGTAYDSTMHGLDGIPSCGTNKLADVSQMVAYEDGACGRARVNGAVNGRGGNYLLVPASRCFSCAGVFTVEGWFRVEDQIVQGTGYDDPRLVSLKPNYYSQETGFEIQFEDGADRFVAKARTNSYAIAQSPCALKAWVKLVADFSGTNLCLYANGSCLTNQMVKSVLDDDASCMAFGNNANGTIWSLNGQYDEIRFRGGSLSADRIKTDYDMIANRAFLEYGIVTRNEDKE